uniref:Uncharacterized protein n=1 Tax=Oncorhynchus kisutch TaxID=8019 RepID=A0A8C7IG38_ONCKI
MGQLLGGVIEMWVYHMDSITQPERRKLYSLALLGTTKGSRATSCPVTQAYQTS